MSVPDSHLFPIFFYLRARSRNAFLFSPRAAIYHTHWLLWLISLPPLLSNPQRSLLSCRVHPEDQRLDVYLAPCVHFSHTVQQDSLIRLPITRKLKSSNHKGPTKTSFSYPVSHWACVDAFLRTVSLTVYRLMRTISCPKGRLHIEALEGQRIPAFGHDKCLMGVLYATITSTQRRPHARRSAVA
ncbi:hypothetical protein SISSUDRAFT_1063285 [Sistotremastrum suecicum HHB10207 ss-3]|uniref:Uncharacterized protein n=1 Tax=Sistotremastrum suecicum HHB10207 ss-3 TaxID=1314776 RepID=A0A166BZV7_9AGAM|nr:hypothetical protein SISSUDRAFT_1063285 [Sistotremastrum suecicum HHB10207 ss-3]